MKYNGSAWETVGTAGFSAGLANYTSIAFNGSTPYVVYMDGGNSNKATVMKYNGSSWETAETAGFSAGAASYTSIAFNGSTAYVVYSSGGAFAKKFELNVLPVKLTAFEASIKSQKQVNLNWQIASENNNSYFTISKSNDGQVFEKLVNVKSKRDNGATYSTIDFSPFAGTSYYKLSQTDADGKTEELEVRTVKLADLAEQALSFYPNPVRNNVLNISGIGKNENEISIYSLTGILLQTEKVNSANVSIKLNKNIVKGIYLLKVNEKVTRIVVD